MPDAVSHKLFPLPVTSRQRRLIITFLIVRKSTFENIGCIASCTLEPQDVKIRLYALGINQCDQMNL
jgi:hypothetical protein